MSTLATGYESKKRLIYDPSAKDIVFPYLRYLLLAPARERRRTPGCVHRPVFKDVLQDADILIGKVYTFDVERPAHHPFQMPIVASDDLQALQLSVGQ